MDNFYEQWLVREEELLDSLLAVPLHRRDLQVPLVSRALSHFAEYYHYKSHLSDGNVFDVLSPPYMTSFERTFIWIGGVRPGLILRFVPKVLSPEQTAAVAELGEHVKQVEKELSARLRRVQEAIPALTLLSVMHGQQRNGDVFALVADQTVESMRRLREAADELREKMVARIVEVLDIPQAVDFFSAMMQFHLFSRFWGLHNPADAVAGTVAGPAGADVAPGADAA